jgi:high-affinity nickel-transport protein
MPVSLALSGSTLGLGLLLGLRHGLDPDHVAVIDNLTFRLAGQRSAWAPWVGTLFAVGHSLSVAVVAIGVSLAAVQFPLPVWMSEAVECLVIGLLILVGVLNLRALRHTASYAPIGFRQGLIPRRLRATSHPAAIVAIGIIFGLVFDTASQAAAWGLAASSQDGLKGVALVSLVFAAGMITTDTIDSQVVARLLKADGDASRVRFYRRGVGWLIVGLSFAMAGYALAAKWVGIGDVSGTLMSAFGLTTAVAVVAFLLIGKGQSLGSIKAAD